VETNIHYPTDSGLLNDGARVLTRTAKLVRLRRLPLAYDFCVGFKQIQQFVRKLRNLPNTRALVCRTTLPIRSDIVASRSPSPCTPRFRRPGSTSTSSSTLRESLRIRRANCKPLPILSLALQFTIHPSGARPGRWQSPACSHSACGRELCASAHPLCRRSFS
jgi:hypothetical protein